MRLAAGLRPDPLGELRVLPRPLAGFKGMEVIRGKMGRRQEGARGRKKREERGRIRERGDEGKVGNRGPPQEHLVPL